METKYKVIGTIAGIVLLVIIIFAVYASYYNSLISADENVKKSWADVQSSYQRRMDLIPNLVATVQGSADFESNTQKEITQLRSQATAAQQQFSSSSDIATQQQAITTAEKSLTQFLVIVESYPQLSSTQNFADLQVQLEGTENRINVVRSAYNDAVQAYNVRVRGFPSSIIANMNGFGVLKPFEAVATAQTAPTVTFK